MGEGVEGRCERGTPWSLVSVACNRGRSVCTLGGRGALRVPSAFASFVRGLGRPEGWTSDGIGAEASTTRYRLSRLWVSQRSSEDLVQAM